MAGTVARHPDLEERVSEGGTGMSLGA
jgi:hypothetical protein